MCLDHRKASLLQRLQDVAEIGHNVYSPQKKATGSGGFSNVCWVLNTTAQQMVLQKHSVGPAESLRSWCTPAWVVHPLFPPWLSFLGLF